ncbi:MAG: sugar transferase [Opitutaceae bacterium]|jgi:lipopolysaccharide/colanic/teichoic acid biosynthesis glycosyltransferase
MNPLAPFNPPAKMLSINCPVNLPAWKRSIDLVCCLVALPFLCLITVLMAIGLRMASPGPILFRQERVGYKGSRFMCYKFRTMPVGADTKSHQAYLISLLGSNAPMVKLDAKNDSRLIPGGWLLRATGLDELPQVINVFRGEMSIVGPRPCLSYEYEEYKPWQRERFNAAPGLTGLWQVSGKNRTTFDEMINLDIRYAETRTFWLDMRIILMTVPALLKQLADTHQARKAQGQFANTPRIFSAESAVKSRRQTAVF